MRKFQTYQYMVAGMVLMVAWGRPGLVAQDPAMSQFYANALFMNPAMAGVEGPAKVYLGYRNQWPSSGGAYTVYHASYDQYLESLQGGLGVHVINDRQGGGILNTTSLDAMYSYHLKVSRWLSLTGGLQASVGQRSRNTEGLVLPDQLAGQAGQGLPGDSKFYPDFAVGFGAFYKHIYGGIACHHLLEPYMSSSKDPNARLHRRYTAHIGALIPIIENRFHREILQLSPNLVFFQQDIYQQINYGLEALYSNFMFGVWLRQDLRFSYGTMIFSLGYARERFRFRYSYDAKLSSPELHIPNMGAHEISMAIVFENLHNTKRKRAIKSPKI